MSGFSLVPEVVVKRLNLEPDNPYNVKDASATGDGQTDDYRALNEVRLKLGGAGTAYFPPGVYRVGSDLTLNCTADFALGATLKPNAGVTITLAGPVTTAPNQRIIALGTAGTVAITGPISSGGGEYNVETFGAKGDGVTDDTAAIQKAIDTGADVVFPSANYLITAPLQVGSQRLIGGVQDKLINRAQTVLTVPGNHPAFINKAGEPSFEIDGFWINFGDTVPTDPVTQGEKMGFKFTTNGFWPAFIAIRNCTVRGAWEGFFDITGTYQAIIERVWTRDCKRGFFKKNGTTTMFNTCFAINGEQGFYIENVLSATILNSGADGLVPSALRNTANYFKDVPGLSIVGLDAESNIVAGNEVSYMRFDNVVGTVAGFCGYLNTLNCAAAEESYLFSVRASSRLQFSGCKAAVSVGDLLFLGSAGSCATIAAVGNSEVFLAGSDFSAPTGGTPAARWSALADGSSSITFTQTTLDNQQTALALVGQDTNGQVGLGGVALAERGSAPAAIANTGVLYTVDNGSGKTKLMVRFGTGAAQQLAIEP